MDNHAYRRKRGTAHKFRTTPEEADRLWAELYPEAVARARERRLKPKGRVPWGDWSVEDGD